MSDQLDWTIKCDDIPPAGLTRVFKADDAERTAVAAALELVACDAFDATLRFHPLADGSYSVSGQIRARVVQTCVVTLEPVPADVRAAVAVEFRRGHDMPDMPEGEFDPHSADEPEPIVRGVMDVGAVAYQILATSLDPYPRRTGVAFDWRDPNAVPATDTGANPENPFAVLAKLKPKG